MTEQLYTDFITNVGMILDKESLEIVSRALTSVLQNYDVQKKCTDVALYDEFPECAKAYIVSRKIEGISKGSLQLYTLRLKQLFSYMQKPITEITTNDVRMFMYEYQSKSGATDRTMDNIRSILCTFFKWAQTEGYVSANPFANIKAIKYSKKERGYLSDFEMEMLRDACKDLRDKAILEILYSTACRVSELVNLDIADINFETDEVRLFGKGNKERISYLNAKAKLAIKNYLDSRTDDNSALIVSLHGDHNRIKKNSIENIIKRLGKDSGIKRRIFPHLIRHTSASHGLQHGMDVTEIQKMLGHADVSTTMIYAKTTETNVKNSHHRCIL